MDVSATGSAGAVAPPRTSVDIVTGNVAPAPQPQAPITNSNPSVQPVPTSQPQTQSQSSQPEPLSDSSGSQRTLAPAIAKLFAIPAASPPISLDVSYRVERDPNVIVTVFTNPKTGQEVAQIPPEVLIQISQFFDQPTGVTLDKNA